MPSTVTTPVALRFPNAVLAELDQLAADRGCDRPEAIRLAVATGLEVLRRPVEPEPPAPEATEPERKRRRRRRATDPPPVDAAEATEPEPAPAPTPEASEPEAHEPVVERRRRRRRENDPPIAAEPEELPAFAAAALDAARQVPEEVRFGENRVFIGRAWREYRKSFPSSTLVRFKKRLLEANRERVLDLVCADMAPFLDQKDVKESEIRYLSATFHFVCI